MKQKDLQELRADIENTIQEWLDATDQSDKAVKIINSLEESYVAKYMELNRTAIVEIEAGKRKVSAEELGKFSQLFKISVEQLLNGEMIAMPETIFARNFGELDESDQQEILNLIEFKKMLKVKRG